MVGRVKWQLLPFVLLTLAGCEAERIGAPAREAAPLPPPVQLGVAVTGDVLCSAKPNLITGEVQCFVGNGSGSWTAPDEIRQSQPVQFELYGASGGYTGSTFGAHGGLTMARRVTAPGTTLQLDAGSAGGAAGTHVGAGAGGSNGGGNGGVNGSTGYHAAGGGGASTIRSGPVLLLAAGGGGGGPGGGPGGGDDGIDAFTVPGGGKGASPGSPGNGGFASILSCPSNDGGSGGPAQGGHGASTTNPFLLQCVPGAGGGGGWFGGGGGASADGGTLDRSGGGGNGHVNPNFGFTNIFTAINSQHEGDGLIKITFYVPLAPPVVTFVTVDKPSKFGWFNILTSGTDGVVVEATSSSDPDFRFLKCYNGAANVLNVNTLTGSFTLTDGQHSISCEASNGLVGAGPGSDDMPRTLKIDQTAPTVAPSISPFPVMLGGAHTASPNASDATSGLVSSSCDPVTTSTPGANTVTCRALDAADNPTTVNYGYNVLYPFAGFFEPVNNNVLNEVQAGRGVPVKFSLGGDRGLAIMESGFPASQTVSCIKAASVDAIEETLTAGTSGLSYNASADVYTYIWKTEKSWANTCRKLTVRLIDGGEYTAIFQLTR